jgi:subtilase family serine protease
MKAGSHSIGRTLGLGGVLVAALCLGPIQSGIAADPGMKILPGHVPAAVAKLAAYGTLPPANRLNLAIGLPLRDARGLDDFLSAVYDPASPHYRQYLTPEQFTEKFGPTAADYAAVTAFALRQNLTVTATHSNRLLLDVSGSVADIQRAFHITLRTYHHPTEARDFYAPDADPSVDASLPISDISGLNNYSLPRPKSLHIKPATLLNAVPKSGSGSGGNYLGKDFRAAYLPGVTLTGTGQMVGLFEFDGYYPSDIAAYESVAGLAPVPLQNVLLDGFSGTPTTGRDSGDIEVSLDIEMAVAMAPGLSKIVVFEAGPDGLQNDVLNAMAANNQIKQLSCSWGWGGGPNSTTDAIFKQIAAQGQSFFTASGDADAYTTGASSVNGVDNPSLDNAPSSCPFITSVGGTTLSTTGPGGSWSSETVWNWGLDDGSYVGSSGGVSSYYAIPGWQAGISMAANGGSTAWRNIPDVALTADDVYVYYDDGGATSVGGTSCATPLWAALTALMNQNAAAAGRSAVGFLNPGIYSLGQSSSYAASFHDIASGNNFSSSSPSEFSAVPGYDLCTGWGTPAGQSLINALAGPPDSLGVMPATGFTATGAVGGPFSQTTLAILLTNSSSVSLPWSVINTSGWLTVAPASGVLAAGGVGGVSVSLSEAAYALGAGIYMTNITFTNWNTHVAQNMPFTLEAGQSVVENGGFETGDFTGWTLVGHTVVRLRGRTTVYNAVEPASSYPLVVHSGNYGAFLGDNQLATLSQSLPTVAGQYYLLSLWLDNPTAGSGQEFLVNWNTNGATANTLFGLTNPPAFAWTNLQFLVSAAGSGTVLEFEAQNTPDYFGLDDVSLTPLPAVAFNAGAKTSNTFSLSWIAATGLVYQVQYKTNLLQTNWLDLGAAFAATNSAPTVSDTNVINPSSQRFYRLLLWP